ncbi:MAG TPA: HD domain-containing protein [Myxococcota bacterium]|nr:HD domain-containing protein [Myxococcota bacterium]HRY96354.1 HD domain-containing protein [Myxococcota bacterium]HSA20793.1 HD domain-containing protein [Myxococcota bacterium]
MAGKVFIEDLRKRLEQARRAGSRPGATVQAVGNFLVQSKQTPLNKNGKPYMALVLTDRTGSAEGRIWDNLDKLPPFEAGDFVEVKGDAVEYQGRMQLKVHTVERLAPEKIDPDEFLPTTTRDRPEMLGRLQELLASIADAPLRGLLLARLQDPDFRARLSRAPAAKSIHHAYVGGLLEHTLSVTELAERVAALYPDLDRDLLLAGAFAHDLGKLEELGAGQGFDYTDEGRLVGHLVLGAMSLRTWAAAQPDLSPEVLLKLEHIVLSHHGEKEYGSPVLPLFTEALIIHHLDLLDSKVQSFREVAQRERGQRWSSFQRQLDRYLLLGGAGEAAPGEAAPELAAAPDPEPREARGARPERDKPLTHRLPLESAVATQPALPLGGERDRGKQG